MQGMCARMNMCVGVLECFASAMEQRGREQEGIFCVLFFSFIGSDIVSFDT